MFLICDGDDLYRISQDKGSNNKYVQSLDLLMETKSKYCIDVQISEFIRQFCKVNQVRRPLEKTNHMIMCSV